MFEKTSQNTPFVTDLASKTDPDSSPRRSGAPWERSGASRSAPGTLGGRSGEASETLRDVVRTLPGRHDKRTGTKKPRKITPRSLQNAPETTPKLFKSLPRRPQTRKNRPKRTTNTARTQDAAKKRQRAKNSANMKSEGFK